MTSPDFSCPSPDQIPAEHRLPAFLEQREYLLNGQIRKWQGPLETVISPIALQSGAGCEQVKVGAYPLLDKSAALAALNAAVQAFNSGLGAWPAMSYRERVGHLERFIVRMHEQRSEVVRLLMWEIGKTYPDSLKEFDRTVEYMRETLKALRELRQQGEEQIVQDGIRARTLRAPFGVVLCLGPFNYPLNETFTTLIPALAMGNTVIFKLPKLGVLLFQPLLEAFRDSFPAGVINTIYGEGREVVGPLMESGKIDVFAFIGSSRVANILIKQHPQLFRLRPILGLGAKNPAIVLKDCDVNLAVKEVTSGSLSFNGQRCTALKLIFVQRARVDEFLAKLSDRVEELKSGMPWDAGVQLTPLPEPGKTDWLSSLVKDAVDQGARVVNPRGGKTVATFFHPAIVYPVNPSMKLYTEEQFGPVIPVVPFDDLSEPCNYIASAPYAQQASVFGSDPLEVAALTRRLQRILCRVNVNSQCQRGPDILPFTGRRESALGTLSIHQALEAFSIESVVAGKDIPENASTLSAALA